MSKSNKFAVVYSDQHLQIERYKLAKALARFEELKKTSVKDLMLAIIVEEANNL